MWRSSVIRHNVSKNCRQVHKKYIIKAEEIEKVEQGAQRGGSYGAGADHALSLGCYSALKAGKTVRWLAEPKCFKCKQVGASIKPVALNSLNRVAFASGEINVFLCANCYQELLFS